MSPFSESLLRKRDKEKAAVSFSELLFDLIYVFAVTQLSHYLLHHLNWLGLIQETLLWFAVWLAWQHTTWVTNWFNPDARPIRLVLFIIMLLGLLMASSIPRAFTDQGSIFACCYMCIQLGRTLYIVFILGNKHALSANFRRILGWFCISAVFWTLGIFYEGYIRLLFWGIAVICDYISPMFGFYLPFLGRSNSSKEWTIEGHHLTERCQLFVIIAFGETILMTGASLSEIEIWSLPVILSAIISFASSLLMWWIYFDVSSEVGREMIRKTSNPGLLGLKFHSIHVILVGALIICAVGDEMVVSEPHGEMTYGSVFALIAGPVIYLIANIVYKQLICKTISLSHFIAIIAYVLLIPFSWHLNILEVNTLSVLILTFIVIFEMLINKQKTIRE